MRIHARRLLAALLILAFSTPLAPLCGSSAESSAAAGAMAEMPCCKKLPPSGSGTIERDCCRMNEGLPERAPASSLPAKTTLQGDATFAPIAAPVAIVFADTNAHHDLAAARGRPGTPTYLRTTVLLI